MALNLDSAHQLFDEMAERKFLLNFENSFCGCDAHITRHLSVFFVCQKQLVCEIPFLGLILILIKDCHFGLLFQAFENVSA